MAQGASDLLARVWESRREVGKVAVSPAQPGGRAQCGPRGPGKTCRNPELGQGFGGPGRTPHPLLGALHFDDLGCQREACGLLRAPVDLAEPAPADTTTQQAESPRGSPRRGRHARAPGLLVPALLFARQSPRAVTLPHAGCLRPRGDPLRPTPRGLSRTPGAILTPPCRPPAASRTRSHLHAAPHQGGTPTYPPKTSCWHTA